MHYQLVSGFLSAVTFGYIVVINAGIFLVGKYDYDYILFLPVVVEFMTTGYGSEGVVFYSHYNPYSGR